MKGLKVDSLNKQNSKFQAGRPPPPKHSRETRAPAPFKMASYDSTRREESRQTSSSFHLWIENILTTWGNATSFLLLQFSGARLASVEGVTFNHASLESVGLPAGGRTLGVLGPWSNHTVHGLRVSITLELRRILILSAPIPIPVSVSVTIGFLIFVLVVIASFSAASLLFLFFSCVCCKYNQKWNRLLNQLQAN